MALEMMKISGGPLRVGGLNSFGLVEAVLKLGVLNLTEVDQTETSISISSYPNLLSGGDHYSISWVPHRWIVPLPLFNAIRSLWMKKKVLVAPQIITANTLGGGTNHAGGTLCVGRETDYDLKTWYFSHDVTNRDREGSSTYPTLGEAFWERHWAARGNLGNFEAPSKESSHLSPIPKEWMDYAIDKIGWLKSEALEKFKHAWDRRNMAAAILGDEPLYWIFPRQEEENDSLVQKKAWGLIRPNGMVEIVDGPHVKETGRTYSFRPIHSMVYERHIVPKNGLAYLTPMKVIEGDNRVPRMWDGVLWDGPKTEWSSKIKSIVIPQGALAPCPKCGSKLRPPMLTALELANMLMADRQDPEATNLTFTAWGVAKPFTLGPTSKVLGLYKCAECNTVRTLTDVVHVEYCQGHKLLKFSTKDPEKNTAEMPLALASLNEGVSAQCACSLKDGGELVVGKVAGIQWALSPQQVLEIFQAMADRLAPIHSLGRESAASIATRIGINLNGDAYVVGNFKMQELLPYVSSLPTPNCTNWETQLNLRQTNGCFDWITLDMAVVKCLRMWAEWWLPAPQTISDPNHKYMAIVRQAESRGCTAMVMMGILSNLPWLAKLSVDPSLIVRQFEIEFLRTNIERLCCFPTASLPIDVLRKTLSSTQREDWELSTSISNYLRTLIMDIAWNNYASNCLLLELKNHGSMAEACKLVHETIDNRDYVFSATETTIAILLARLERESVLFRLTPPEVAGVVAWSKNAPKPPPLIPDPNVEALEDAHYKISETWGNTWVQMCKNLNVRMRDVDVWRPLSPTSPWIKVLPLPNRYPYKSLDNGRFFMNPAQRQTMRQAWKTAMGNPVPIYAEPEDVPNNPMVGGISAQASELIRNQIANQEGNLEVDPLWQMMAGQILGALAPTPQLVVNEDAPEEEEDDWIEDDFEEEEDDDNNDEEDDDTGGEEEAPF